MNELIQELTKKGKYTDWVSCGSYLGHTSNGPGYKYYDMDGDIINVSYTSKEYRDDVINIPVFKQYWVNDPTNVRQAKYKIVRNNEELSVSGLVTCCGLAIIGEKKFLAHLDASIDKIPCEELTMKLTRYDKKMVEILRNDLCNDLRNKPVKATIYAGNVDSYVSVKKAKMICDMVGINDITMIEVDMFDRISI